MTAATTIAGLVLDAVENYAETEGLDALANVVSWASSTTAAYAAYYEEHPVQATAALFVGTLAVVAIGPEATTAEATATLANVLQKSFTGLSQTVAQAISASIITNAIENTGESVFN